jgi:hypothetical protein
MSRTLKLGLLTMFCVLVWCNTLPTRLALHKLQVFSKISNTFVGHVEKTCNYPSQKLQAYLILRYIQNQVAKMLKHDYLPARYLAIYVGSSRLTKPDFPFVDELDAQESSLVLEALQRSLRIDVMYDEADTFDHAKRLNRCYKYGHALYVNDGALVVLNRHRLVTREMEVCNFPIPIETIVVYRLVANSVGDVALFSHLRCFTMDLTSELCKPNMADLASCKMLETLKLRLNDPSGHALVGISKLTNLQHLTVLSCSKEYDQQIKPFPEITMLTKLHTLYLFGTQVGGCIPKEIGKLACLTSLTFNTTSLSSSIPSEIGQLSKLKYLCLFDNLFLDGQLPGELNNLVALEHIHLFGTPNVVFQSVMTHGSWEGARWSSI